MLRILLQFGPLTIYSYGVMMVVAFLTVTWLAEQDARRLLPQHPAVTPPQVVDLLCLGMLGGIVGARLLYVMQYWAVYRQHLQEILAIWHGGLIWYGGLLGGLLAAAIYLRIAHIAFLRAMDQCIPYLALAHAIGRIGCFLNGCCYGLPTTAWYGVRFPDQPGPVIPTQLAESALLLVFFLLLRRWQRTAVMEHRGRLFSIYLIGYGVIRFGVEFLRGDQQHYWLGLSVAQFLSVGLVVVGLIVFVAARHVPRRGRVAHQ